MNNAKVWTRNDMADAYDAWLRGSRTLADELAAVGLSPQRANAVAEACRVTRPSGGDVRRPRDERWSPLSIAEADAMLLAIGAGAAGEPCAWARCPDRARAGQLHCERHQVEASGAEGKRLVRCEGGCRTEIETRAERAWCGFSACAIAIPRPENEPRGAYLKADCGRCGFETVHRREGMACTNCEARHGCPPSDPYVRHHIEALREAAEGAGGDSFRAREVRTLQHATCEAGRALEKAEREHARLTELGPAIARLRAALAEHGERGG